MSRTVLVSMLLLMMVSAVSAIDTRKKGVVVIDQITADSLLKQGDAEFQERSYDSALATYTRAAELARKEFNHSVETEAFAQIARMHLIQNQKDEGRPYLEQAAAMARESDPMGWSRYLGVKGRFEWQDDSLKAARATFEKMYDYCSVNALHGRAVDAAHMIAIVAETPEEQIAWGKRGIEAAEAADQERWLGPLWNNLAATYYDARQFDSALACYERAREYHWRYSGEVAKLFADYHVGMTYRYLGNFDEAARWLRPVLAWAERIELHGAIGQACEDLGEIALARGEQEKGVELLKRAREEYRQEGYDKTWPEIWTNINERLNQLEH